MYYRTASIVRLTLGTLALAATALAQENNAPDDAEAGEEIYELSRFTVFGEKNNLIGAATRLPLTNRETPQTISVIDGSRLENESMFSMDDVMRNVTGVNVSLYDTQRPLYFSRGFLITDFQVDGLPTYSNDTNQEYDTALYEEVEILRGANGLFSGTGLPSGTINLRRKKPFKSFDATAHISIGSWNFYRGQVDVNAPLTDDGRFRSRFVAAYTDRDSFRDRYHEEKLAYLATVAGDFTESTTLTVGYQRQENEPTASVWGTIPQVAADGTPSELSHTTNFATDWAYWTRESGTFFANLEHRLGDDWQLKAAYNHTEGEERSKSVYANPYAGSWLNKTDGSGVILSGTYWETEDQRDSVDLYVNGAFMLLGGEHDVVFGMSYSDYTSDSPNTDAGYTWFYQIPNFYTWDGSAPELTFNYLPGSYATSTEQTGIYASTRFRITDALSTIVGGRITNWETREFERADDGSVPTIYTEYEVEDAFTPYAGLTYDLTKALTLYTSYTAILQPQNYLDIDGHNLDPVEGINIEAGLKASFANGRAIFTAAVFETSQDNFAVVHPDYVGVPSTPTNPTRYIGVDGTKSQGVEFQVSGRVTKDWSVIFGYTFNDTSRHADDPIWTNLPEHLVQLSTHYQFPGAWRRLAVGGGLTWQSKIEGTLALPSGDVTTSQDAYALVNFHLNYEVNEHLSFTVSAKNAFNEIYYANLDYPNFGEPRNLIFTLKWRL